MFLTGFAQRKSCLWKSCGFVFQISPKASRRRWVRGLNRWILAELLLSFIPGSCSLVILPDTQHYTECYAGILNLQAQWIVDNKEKYNIAYALTLGDITNHNNKLQWGRANRAIIATHACLYSDSTRYNWKMRGEEQRWNPHKYETAGGVNDGEQVWQKPVKKHGNVVMTINGHVLNDGPGFLVSKADHGNLVNQMLVNFQGPIHPLGGEGWLRLLEFLPDGHTVQAKTYSPYTRNTRQTPIINSSSN